MTDSDTNNSCLKLKRKTFSSTKNTSNNESRKKQENQILKTKLRDSQRKMKDFKSCVTPKKLN